MGMRRLFNLIRWLPYESAIGSVLRKDVTPEATPNGKAPDEGKPVSGWGDLARTLQSAKAIKKKKKGR